MFAKKSVFHLFSVLIVLISMLAFEGSPGVSAKSDPQAVQADARALKKADQCLGAGAETASHALTGQLRFVGVGAGQPIQQADESLRFAAPEDAARGYLSQCGSLFGLSDQASELAVKRQTKTEDGRFVLRFQQSYEGVPILGAELVVQVNSTNEILLVNGDMLPGGKLNVQADIDASTAQETALQIVADQYGVAGEALKVSEAQLRIFSPALMQAQAGPTALVWQMEVRLRELGPIRELVLIDAHSGELALNFNQVHTGRNRLTYTANNTTSRPGALVCNESNPNCAGGDAHAVNAHVYAGDTYNFYLNYHGRDSINNAGMALVSTVHYSSGYCNAFWDGSQMTYGDGCFIVVDDVVAHELTHGVTEYESGLIYQGESGAINESFSDIWGEFVDLTNGKGNDTAGVRWLTGEDTSVGAIRNMKDPTTFGDPDRMDSPYYYHGTADHGGVHTNSGVSNKAAYLITDGATFNGYTVTGIGITKAAKIYYEAQTHILTSTSTYYSLYNALYQACNTLIGTSGITAANCTEVRKATQATRMNLNVPATNDAIATPVMVGSLPYTNTQSTGGATTAASDPVMSCVGGQRYNTVWYRYIPAVSQTLTIDTIGSTYDTVLAVWTGSPGSLVSAGCNDDGSGVQSKVTLAMTAGVPYYIEAASFFSGGGTLTLHVTGPVPNDAIATPVVIGSLPYTNNQSTVTATTAAGDPVLECTFAQGYKTVWYRYTAAVSQTLTVDTFGSNYDTVLAVWTGSPGSLTSVGCNDEALATPQSQVTVVVTAGVSYYIEVASFFSGGGALTLHATGVPFPTISGNVGASGVTLSYTDGVLKTATADASGFYSFPVTPGWDGTVTPSPACFTFTPLSKNYVNVTVNQTSQNYTAAFNGASGCSNISIDIAGSNLGNYGVTPETSTRASFAENNGPVEATSPNGVPFLIAERDAWLLNGVVQSFSEMMGLPGNQVTDTYYFPWYNNVTMDTQLRFANLGNTSTNITVTIAGIQQPVIPLAAGVSTRVSYPINNGPVKVQSSGGVPIIVAERDAWLMNGVVQSFSEMMGLPANQLTDTYYFPWYNNVTMDTQLRFANLGAVPTNITVTIAGVPQTPITVAAGESTRVSYPINAGPVKVQSSDGTPIIVAERDAWLINGVVKSFSEMMGLPGNQLATTYHFPWYNNITMDTQLRFANLGNASTDITVTIAGVAQTPITVAAGESTRISYPINDGPVTVTSSGGVPIIVAERDAWLLNGAVRSFSEMMGLPGNQLTTTYYFPWYNNLTMDTQLRFAVP